MRGRPLILTVAQRTVVCKAIGDRLLADAVEVIELSVGGMHFHVLCRFPNWTNPDAPIPGLHPGNALQDGRDPVPRHLLGRAKKHASHVLRQLKLKPSGRTLWAKRTKAIPIRNHSHQCSVAQYIRDHQHEGAVLWTDIPDGMDIPIV